MSDSDYIRHILLVDPDEVFGHVLQQVLGASYSLRQVATVQTGVSLLNESDVDVVLLNLDLRRGTSPTEDPLALVAVASEQESALPVIAYGWDTKRKRAMEAFHHGAVDFLEQPLDVQALKFALDAAYRRATLTRELAAAQKLVTSSHVEGLLGNSKPMARVNEVIRKVAGVFTSVMITGESGTGKEVVARAIHNLSQRADKPFVAFSACAFPESLIEDELFGHEKGPLPAPSRPGVDASKKPRAARFFWMRLASCRCRCKPNCCACSRSAPWSGWVRTLPSPLMSG